MKIHVEYKILLTIDIMAKDKFFMLHVTNANHLRKITRDLCMFLFIFSFIFKMIQVKITDFFENEK